MVLLVDGGGRHDQTSDVRGFMDWLCSFTPIKDTSTNFHAVKTSVKSDSDLIYVHQGEMATLIIEDPLNEPEGELDNLPSSVASDDATSCVILIMHSGKACIIAHLDTDLRTVSFFTELRRFLAELNDYTPMTVYILGGIDERQGLARKISYVVFSELLRDASRIYELKLYCIGELNTRWLPCPEGPRKGSLINFPIATGVLYNWRNRTVSSASLDWVARGPVPALRLARLQSREGWDSITNVFDPRRRLLIVEPFGQCISYTAAPQSLTAEEIRAHSTTPDQEPATYFDGVRAVAFLVACHPHGSFWFPNKRRLVFVHRRRTDSTVGESHWIPANAATAFACSHPLTKVNPGFVHR